MKKMIFWILGIIALIGLVVGLVFLLNGTIDLSTATATLSTEAPSNISTSAGGMR